LVSELRKGPDPKLSELRVQREIIQILCEERSGTE